jgi:hypothetical protein
LGRIHDSTLDYVGIAAHLGVISLIDTALLQQLANHHRAVLAGVPGDQMGWIGERDGTISIANLLVIILRPKLSDHPCAIDQSHTAAGHNAFLDRGAGRVQGIVDRILAFSSPCEQFMWCADLKLHQKSS